MTRLSGINWCYYSLGYWIGCTHVSARCNNCFAERDQDHRYHRVQWGDHPRRRTAPGYRRSIFAMDRAAAAVQEQRRVFINPNSDFFDNQVPQEWRDEAYADFRQCEHVDLLLLTKRIQNARRMLPPDWNGGWPNVWLGVTVENMTEARRHLSLLLRIPAVCHYVSAEPMLEPRDLRPWLGPGKIDWVICGGESGSDRREMDTAWARDLRDQCRTAGTAFYMKQMTAFHPTDDMIPADLMVRDLPELDD
jgi:protein gp37